MLRPLIPVSTMVIAMGLIFSSGACQPEKPTDPLASCGHQERRMMTVSSTVGNETGEVVLDLVEEEEGVEMSDDKFGDPSAGKIDVKNIGLGDLLSNKLGKSGAISSILADDADQFENRMAVAMSGGDVEPVPPLIVSIDNRRMLAKCFHADVVELPAATDGHQYPRLPDYLRDCTRGLEISQMKVVVAAQDQVEWEAIQNVLDQLRSAGFSRLVLADAASVAVEMM